MNSTTTATTQTMHQQVTISMPLPHNMPKDDRMVGDGVGFERIRRITGYLVGTLDRFNNAKRAEVSERVKHTVTHHVEL